MLTAQVVAFFKLYLITHTDPIIISKTGNAILIDLTAPGSDMPPTKKLTIYARVRQFIV